MKTMKAIYENGVFRPEEPVALPEGCVVEFSLPDPEPLKEDAAAAARRMKERYPESFGIFSEEEADEMLKIINEEFGKIENDE